METPDLARVAAIFRAAFNDMYRRRGFGPVVTDPAVGAAIAETYLSLDPEHCLVVVRGDRIVGSGFLHVRGQTAGVGPITIDPSHQGAGCGRLLMEQICSRSDRCGVQSLRLIQDAFNEVSFSLYGRMGFVARETLVRGSFPSRGPVTNPRPIRRANRGDVAQIVTLERDLLGLVRPKDHSFLLRTAETLVSETAEIEGSLTRLVRGRVAVVGPAVSRTLETMLDLIEASTADLPVGSEIRMLLPASRQDLLSSMYQNGFEVHSLCSYMVRGTFQSFTGYYIPTLLPESG